MFDRARSEAKNSKGDWSMSDITNETETFDWVIYGDGRIETNGH